MIPALVPDLKSDFQPFDNSGFVFRSSKKRNCNTSSGCPGPLLRFLSWRSLLVGWSLGGRQCRLPVPKKAPVDVQSLPQELVVRVCVHCPSGGLNAAGGGALFLSERLNRRTILWS